MPRRVGALEESLHGSRGSEDDSGQPGLGVSPCMQTGLPGMESDSQLLQKALGKNQPGVINSC